MEKDQELIQFIEEEFGIINPNKDEIEMLGKTYFYQRWRLERAYADFAREMRKSIEGSFIMKIIETLNKWAGRIF